MRHIPLFDRIPDWEQVVRGLVVPSVFGILTGLVLNWNELAYLIMAGPIGIGGGFFAGYEHRGTEQGALRGVVGGLLFGSFILLGNELAGADPEAHLPSPQILLVVITAGLGAALGAVGGRLRAKRPEPARAPEPGAP